MMVKAKVSPDELAEARAAFALWQKLAWDQPRFRQLWLEMYLHETRERQIEEDYTKRLNNMMEANKNE